MPHIGRTLTIVMIAGIGATVNAVPTTPPLGYQLTTVSTGVSSDSLTRLSQLTFKPGDATHLYASRGFANVVTRYDYNPATAALSNPLDLVNLTNVADGMKAITGIGFHGNDLWISRWPGWTSPRPGALSRLRDANNDGDFNDANERLDVVTGVELGAHTFNQIQIRGNELYVGIGKRTNNGNPAVEDIYNGTINRIGDLNNPVVMNLTLAADRSAYEHSSITDGRFRRYASGFRNPYGLRVDAEGTVWVGDNGADAQGAFPETSDLFYKDVKRNDIGRFPPAGQPGAPTPTLTPLSVIGSHKAPSGFDVIASGPDRGKILLALSANNTSGRRLVLVDPDTGSTSDFLSGFLTATDIIADANGRLLISDWDLNAIYAIKPPRDADANLDRRVDIADFKALAMNWQMPATWAQGDFDRNGFVDADDLALLSINWDGGAGVLSAAMAAASLPTNAVPEPSLLVFGSAVICATSLSRCSRRRNTPPNA